jgi:hypothetical protein
MSSNIFKFSGNYKSDFIEFGSSMDMVFERPSFYPFILQPQLTTLDFVSYCGGSLGLFLGFSLISAVEIVYYFVVRLVFGSWRRKVAPEENLHHESEKKLLSEVIATSTIHGFNQIAFKNQHVVERFDIKQ